jgi:signal transduction histidine kinase
LRQRVEARDRLVTQAEDIGLAVHDQLLGALARGDLVVARNSALHGETRLRELTEGLRIYQAELRAQAEELALSQAQTEQVLGRFAALFGSLPVAALLVSAQGQVLEHNVAADRLFGLAARPTAARFLHRLVQAEAYQQRAWPAIQEARGAGASRVDDLEFIGDGARGFIGELHISRLPGLGGALGDTAAYACVVVDRTEHLEDLRALQAAHESLRANEAFLADSARLARVGGFELLLEPRRWRVSDELRTVLAGAAADAATLPGLLSRCLEPGRSALRDAIAAAEHGEAFELEVDLDVGNGRGIIRLRALGHPDFFAGRVVRVSGVLQDVTQQHRAKLRIGELSERLQMANEAGGIGVYDWNLASGQLELDARAMRLLRAGGAQTPARGAIGVAGLAGLLRDAVRPEEHEVLIAAVQATSAHGVPLDLELRARGEPARWLHVNGSVQRDAAGRAQRVVGCVWDTTAAHDAERLRTEKDVAEAASRSKSAFLSRISHELRTPLNAILGFSQLMRLDADRGDLQLKPHRVELIESAARHLLALVNEVLDITRVEAGHVAVRTVPTDLRQVVHEALALMLGQADAQGVQVQDELGASPAAVLPLVQADPLRLKQVVLNLVGNAIKYNRRGGRVVVSARVASGGVHLHVADDGPGLTPEQRAQLFQPFNRAGAENSGIEGSGMGLYVSRRFVELMGGRVELHGDAGQGTDAVVVLCAAGEAVPLGALAPVLPVLPAGTLVAAGNHRIAGNTATGKAAHAATPAARPANRRST